MKLHRALPAIFIALATVQASAQPGTIRIDTDWVFDATGAHPGGSIRAALGFALPGKYHVQSDRPLDAFLVPTTLTLALPTGSRVWAFLTIPSIRLCWAIADVVPRRIASAASASTRPLRFNNGWNILPSSGV